MTTEITKILEGFKKYSENPYLDSINFLRDYIEVDPSSEAFFELGKALFFNGEYLESIKHLEKSNDPRSDAFIGLNYYKMNDYPSAIRHLRNFLRDNRNETILSYLMLSYENEHDFKNAVKCGDMLLEINPDNDSVKVHLADCHYKAREYEKSLAYLNELDDRKLKYKKALVLFKLKRYGEAIDEVKSLKTVEAYRLMSRSYERLGKPAKAVMCMQNAYKLDYNVETLFEIAEIYSKNANHQNACNIMERILRTNPENEKALEMMAESHFELQNFELALSYCNDLLEVNKKNYRAYLILSETYMYLNDSQKVFENVEKGLEINPESSELWIQKAWAYFPIDFEEFKKSFEKALKLEPNNIKNHITLIEQCRWEGESENARRYYERLLFYNPACTLSFDEIYNGRIVKKHDY
ncbi:MAG: CDC27 family protein [Methanobrevibacter sp.]|nr:CDC27 family protein [Methanobrevibacter sp.]